MRRPLSTERLIDAPLLDEQEIAALLAAAPGLPTAARRSPRTRRPGDRLSPQQGSGTDFAEPRAYQPGDDPRRIDWRATARSKTALVRSYHAEFSRPVCVVVDRRAGMRFGTRARLKVTQAARVALWFAGREARAGGDFAAVLLDAPCQWLPPSRGSRALKRLVDATVAPCPPRPPGTGEPRWGSILAGLRRRLPQGSELVLMSDFAGLGLQDGAALRAIGRHFDCRAIRIVDPSEQGALSRGALQLCWDGVCRSFDGADPQAADVLLHRRGAWEAFLADGFRHAGIRYETLPVDVGVLNTLLAGV